MMPSSAASFVQETVWNPLFTIMHEMEKKEKEAASSKCWKMA